ncbi:DUF3054 domain-containing protein [Luteococcus japonicus]|uniref:PROBABLE CONSERVED TRANSMEMBRANE PROTEIN n=1 Tax=Luteococcus japonicus LSP_Lj1 TaxID=1255658 RepID=A0A1R4IQN8_9ACTN|nr:DUF3054 domain-containing protein [Luteococcus japonicus]SJN22048.1 PROBABLE CONSERVED TRANSMEMBRANE PROTEIN [Luteococcus japonicus LSP_Lj1]
MTKQVALALDLALVVLFSIIGVLSHSESLVSRLAPVVWPFLVACAVAWLILLWRHRPVGTLAAGVFVWLCTALGGLGLRAAAGGGTQTAFIIVTLVVTGIFLVGWRLLLRKKLVGI